MRRIPTAAALAVLALAACRSADSPAGPSVTQPAIAAVAQADKYIVVYRSSVTDTRAEITRHVSVREARVKRVFENALRGWSGDLSPAELIRVRSDPDVAFVERDTRVTIQTTQAPTPSWGLDRIDQRPLPLNSSYGYNRTGAGVHFYGIDTGILYSHSDFGGRASSGFDAVTSGAVDCNGHGTYTASTAAGNTYGVAKSMIVVGVRVLDCNGGGWTSDVIAGVDWVTQHAIKPAVANMSLGGAVSAALDQAVANSIASGVVYTIASGNSNTNACNSSPGRLAAALTVNASGSNDARASFSNFGTCTDIFAPGVNIKGAWIGSTSATATASGTSAAAPHVAGVAGLYLQANPGATPSQVATALLTNATQGVVTGSGTGSPNRLLYMGFIGGGPVNQSPSAMITLPGSGASFAQGASVAFAGSGSDPEDGTLSGASLVWTSSRDGQIGTGTGFSKSNLSVGTHTITLTAKDSKLATGTASRTITVTSTGGTNKAPTASFTAVCNFPGAHKCTFNASGSTDDSGIVSYLWTWAPGWTSTTTSPITTNTWDFTGTKTVTLKVTDAGGLTATITKSVAVP